MRRSKLELYEDIISALTKRALTIDGIAFECNMDCVILQQRLDFLVNNNIAEIEISRDNRAYYVLTRRGLAISKTVDITKRMKKMQTNAKTANEALQTIPALPEHEEEKATRTR
jgi:predicted transcriptional regulator